MASALNPNFALLWHEEDHPGSDDVKKAVQNRIISKLRLLFIVYH